ncbi:MAG: aspartate 1-decarboxylase [bacterium]|nr:aspartate 1-decarboxylase [bacterium]
MLIKVLKTKISYAKVTHTELYYDGSITIDESIMKLAGLREFEQVDIVNVNNGERLTTYVIKGSSGSNIFGLNGPAARKAVVGDYIHILGYGLIGFNEDTPDPEIINMKIADNK